MPQRDILLTDIVAGRTRRAAVTRHGPMASCPMLLEMANHVHRHRHGMTCPATNFAWETLRATTDATTAVYITWQPARQANMTQSVDLQPVPFVSYCPLTFARSQHHPPQRAAATPAYELLFNRAHGCTLFTPSLRLTTGDEALTGDHSSVQSALSETWHGFYRHRS